MAAELTVKNYQTVDLEDVEATWRFAKRSNSRRRWRPRSPRVARVTVALLIIVTMALLFKLSYLTHSKEV